MGSKTEAKLAKSEAMDLTEFLYNATPDQLHLSKAVKL